MIDRHAEKVSKAKLILIAVCLVAIVVSFVVNHIEIGGVNHRVTTIESPCVRSGPKSEACKEAFEEAVLTITHPEACAILRKAGLEITRCRGARLKQERRRRVERKGGGALHTPTHTAHQQPAPHHGGGGSAEAPGAGSPQGSGSTHPGVPQPTEQPSPGNPPASRTQPEPVSGPKPEAPPTPVPVPTPQLPVPVSPVVEQVTGTVGAVVAGAEEHACSATTALGVCP